MTPPTTDTEENDTGTGTDTENTPEDAPADGDAADLFDPRDPGPTSSESWYELYADAAGEWRWRLLAPNGHIIATSGEGYTRRADAVEAVERVRTYATTTVTLDLRIDRSRASRLARARERLARLLARDGSGDGEEAGGE